ncbi:hypothetical protein AAFF_G00222610 [Aldrovandia affinis]|uniref:Uncharacterized protein n=1 Tax=Aldrovandia affinis TaxID=143900 RepID=A0AAD7W4K3_9TELE|nr:hypothetical protein AAFF_G00222610 [Aldrovandia affinis]
MRQPSARVHGSRVIDGRFTPRWLLRQAALPGPSRVTGTPGRRLIYKARGPIVAPIAPRVLCVRRAESNDGLTERGDKIWSDGGQAGRGEEGSGHVPARPVAMPARSDARVFAQGDK